MDRITFNINGEQCSVGSEVCSDTSLLDYIRDERQLHGTKYMCREAGCGACIVTAVTTPEGPPLCVNSCMVSIASCQGWDITTIEKVGNRKDGYHPLQIEFAKQKATQCGYCTPGWIMNMYSYIKAGKKLTMEETENAFGSNICRCTGYRPILDALKSFASDAPLKNRLPDIEDLKICSKTGENCSKGNCDEKDWCILSNDETGIVNINLKDGKKWFIVRFISDIFQVLKDEGSDSYMLIQGNTAKGAHPITEYPRILIDISKVDELQYFGVDQNLIIGAGVTITKLLDILQSTSAEEDFGYLEKLCDHVKLVAHVPVRNIGSVGGNLMIKHEHNDFPSDIFLIFETVGAALTIECNGGMRQTVSMQQFLQTNMKGKVILNVLLPPLSEEYKLVTYKIMSRYHSTHSTVNAGFLYKLNSTNIVQQCRIVYGHLSPSFNRAIATENFLVGKNLFCNDTLQFAMKVLEMDLVVTESPPEASAAFRKRLALNLFYKGLLSLCPEDLLHPRFASGATDIHASRPVSQGRQFYDTDKSLWPLNQPLEKVEGLIQSSGEAQYTDDIPKIANEAYVSFVVTTVATGTIVNIDPSKALAYPGVISFFSAKDIPGTNSFTPVLGLFTTDEEVFCDGNVKYLDQPLGIIVAETQKIAYDASKLVEVTYSDVKAVAVVDIKDAVTDSSRVSLYTTRTATDKGSDVAKVISHKNTIYGQYPFAMETMVCVARPSDQGLDVFATTQWPDAVQQKIADALKIDASRIDVCVRRLGGAFGFKVTRTGMTAVACSLAAYLLNRPTRLVQRLQDNTRSMGKRAPCMSEWEFAVNSSGTIQYSNLNMYEDNGYKINENYFAYALDAINNCYDNKRWNYNLYNVITDTPKNTFCRSPGNFESVAMAEFKMERISYELSIDPLTVRMANLDSKYDELKQMIETVKTKSDYEKRAANVKVFNTCNRWKKRGIRLVPLRWTPLAASIMEVIISVYHGDGTVAISHGGIEMGQGLNTNAVQVCASLLNISVEKIKIKTTNTISAPNSFVTGGSITGQNVCTGVKKCCAILLERLAPIKAKLENPTWEQVVAKAFEANVSLLAHGSVAAEEFESYEVYGVTVAEVEIDVLTAQCEVIRVDLLEDVGQCINPCTDVGQVEGAFMMGLGYWTCERLEYNASGSLLTDRSWNYIVPQAKDIPQELYVYLRQKSYSNDSAFGSKCAGEAPICMSVVIPLAIRAAISSARLDAGIPTNQWFNIDGPHNLEAIGMATGVELEHMRFF